VDTPQINFHGRQFYKTLGLLIKAAERGTKSSDPDPNIRAYLLRDASGFFGGGGR
jgi:hypothetical protein